MGTVPAHRRGIAAGARTMLQNTGAVLSIAFVMAIVTVGGAEGRAAADLLRRRHRASPTRRSTPFVQNMHTALWVLAATSLVGAAVSLLRPPHVAAEPAAAGTA